MAMQLNGAAKSIVYALNWEPKAPPDRSAPIGHDLIERAAEALYEFVFSGCYRLDGKHHWEHCSEETKEGFRREASAVLQAVWPILSPREVNRRAGKQ
jgi:hypothetical protein